MNRLRWYIRILSGRLGREGLLGLGMLALAFAAYLVLYMPTQTRITQLRREVDTLAASSRDNGGRERSRSSSLPERLSAYYRFFPAQDTVPDWLNKIYRAAKKQNLALIEGKYSAKHERAGRLIRYEINLPVTGSYRQIHLFVGKILSEIPIAALNSITYERHKIADNAVDAKIKLSLYLGQAS
jgi:Tfp pilus assembly protein PilO